MQWLIHNYFMQEERREKKQMKSYQELVSLILEIQI